MAVAPITVVMDGQTTIVAITDPSGHAVPVFLDAGLGTLVTQPYRVAGRSQVTLWHTLAGATEAILVTALVEGEPAARQSVTLGTGGVTVTLADSPTPVADPVNSGAIDCGSSS